MSAFGIFHLFFLVLFDRNAQSALLSAGQVFSASAQRGFDDLAKKSASPDRKGHFEGLFHVFFYVAMNQVEKSSHEQVRIPRGWTHE